METKLNICMLFDLPHKSGHAKLGPANRKGITTYLTNFGHNVTWVISAEGINDLQQFRLGDTCVFATPYICLFNDSSLMGKIFNSALSATKRIRSLLKIFGRGKYNLIYVQADILDGLAATYIKRRYGLPFVFDSEPLGLMWEIYKIKSRGPRFVPYLLSKFHDSMTMYIMKKADLITPSSKWFGEALAQKGISERRLMPYPNGIDVASFSNKDGKAIREEYQLGDSQVIAYIGTLDKARNLSLLIEAFSEVKKNRKKAKLLMVGEGSDKENLQALANMLGVEEEVIFTGQVPGSEVPKFIAAAEIGVSPVAPLPGYRIGSPLKVLEYMGAGKPVVANEEIYDQQEMLEKSRGGILVPFTAAAFASAIIELLSKPEEAAEMGRRGQEWVIKNRSYEVLARRLEKRYLALLNKQGEI